MTSGEVSIRVRYAETDRMGLLHHAQYLVFFEQARIDLLRAGGLSYRDIEDRGFRSCTGGAKPRILTALSLRGNIASGVTLEVPLLPRIPPQICACGYLHAYCYAFPVH